MPYLLGTNIPDKKSLFIGLTHIYGLNMQKATKICYQLGLNKMTLTKNLTHSQLNRIQRFVSQHYSIQGVLKKEKRSLLLNLLETKSYRAKRHMMNLPVRGQRTRSNANTVGKSIK